MSSPAKPRPRSAYQLSPVSSTHPSSADDHQDGDLELRRQVALKSKLNGTAKTSLNWLWRKSGILGNWMNKQTGKIGMEAFWPSSLDIECDKCARILYTFTQRGVNGTIHSTLDEPQLERKTARVALKKIPTHIIQQAEGLAIFTVFRSEPGSSSASGSGVVISRDSPTTWGAPSGILIHTSEFGFLAGVEVYDVVLVLRTQKSVMSFAKPKVSLGAELVVVAGPIGNGVSFDSAPETSPVFSYTKSKGIYGGFQLDGNIIIERTDENARFYGRKVKAEQILQGGAVAVPRAASGLIAVIDAAEGKTYDPEDFPQSIDVAPSEESTGVSTIRESRAKAAEETGVAEAAENEESSEPSSVEDYSLRRRTMPPMSFHLSSSPGKAKPDPKPSPAPAVEADKENAPVTIILPLVNSLAAPPPPPPRRRGHTVSRPSTGGSTDPRPPSTLASSQDKLQPSTDPTRPPADLEALSIPDSVALLSNTPDNKPPEPFLLHERSDSSHSITSPPNPSETALNSVPES
ncbi:hypothetical protein, variant [Puccinia triticina 1-1 BBBD Race 1]|uniref:Ysc84 domain-containing protein n=2 Tax=Puccinia triticina TaxID=208348 RepID=A0A180GLH4_PUCT1|nr:uncharacterized protein PtA15_11A76 [Puccinia triticina]OAV93212.1 hypothetical protein PTTG_05592 [Puccinia triticina 1-1 BBBD Race 1]OAV93213.1 hypothetical protein, variant [Puccinia triticina 1-1 BBBD Race 1]WAQ89389.1 hypothetical protein PtA15_11A76 [Puccinia triticina]WAR59441.1 hypothetical protein PtB15_11B81 [Puccinia triticina]